MKISPILSVLLALHASLALAEARPELSNGMTFADVLRNWGTPDEKIEKETRREVVWIYGDRAVAFREGRLISGTLSTQPVSAPAKKPKISEHQKIAAPISAEPKDAVPMDDILTEVLRSIPSDPDAKPSSRNPGIPPMNRIIPGRPGGEMDEEIE